MKRLLVRLSIAVIILIVPFALMELVGIKADYSGEIEAIHLANKVRLYELDTILANRKMKNQTIDWSQFFLHYRGRLQELITKAYSGSGIICWA